MPGNLEGSCAGMVQNLVMVRACPWKLGHVEFVVQGIESFFLVGQGWPRVWCQELALPISLTGNPQENDFIIEHYGLTSWCTHG